MHELESKVEALLTSNLYQESTRSSGGVPPEVVTHLENRMRIAFGNSDNALVTVRGVSLLNTSIPSVAVLNEEQLNLTTKVDSIKKQIQALKQKLTFPHESGKTKGKPAIIGKRTILSI